MSSVRKQTSGTWSDYLLLLVLAPIASMVLLLAGSGQSTQATAIGSPSVVTQPKQTVMPAPTNATSPTPATNATPVATNSQKPTVDSENAAYFLAKYGEHIYPTLQSMPADMLTWYLTWIHRVSLYYGVPEEDILTVHYAELMGGGFNPLETRRSKAHAGGPGQIIPQTWNGWSCGSYQTVFMTDPASIAKCGGIGTDFDGNGIADIDSLPDNLAATAKHIKRDGITTALRTDNARHEVVLTDALALYNSGTTYWQASALTRTYVGIGLKWWRANRDLMSAYLSAYVANQ